MKLIIINGPCGIGKSTVAGKLHAVMPLSFLLDIDAQRRNISEYRTHNKQSGERVKEVALSIVQTYMKQDGDVIVDKMIFDPAFLDALHDTATQYGGIVHEVLLWAPKDVVMKRAEDRGYTEDGLLTPEKCEMFWENIHTLKESRKHATIIDVTELNEEEVFDAVKRIVMI